MKLRWTRGAMNDLYAIRDYVARDKPAAAEDLFQRIHRAANILAEYPQVGRKGFRPGARELVVAGTPYLIVYRVGGQGIEILMVWHGARGNT